MIDLCFVVCVEFDDLLALSLPSLLRHCRHVRVVTSLADADTHELVRGYRVAGYPVSCHRTDVFYAGGAAFNKGAAIATALQAMELRGWLCLADADVVWPPTIDWGFLVYGRLYTPRRRICDPPAAYDHAAPIDGYPACNEREHAGYCQIFHADDSRLCGRDPVYPVRWRHAGGSDSEFQSRWPECDKVRPPFEVLHLGEPWQNWHGRCEPRLDGRAIPEASARALAQQQMRLDRRDYGFSKEVLG